MRKFNERMTPVLDARYSKAKSGRVSGAYSGLAMLKVGDLEIEGILLENIGIELAYKAYGRDNLIRDAKKVLGSLSDYERVALYTTIFRLGLKGVILSSLQVAEKTKELRSIKRAERRVHVAASMITTYGDLHGLGRGKSPLSKIEQRSFLWRYFPEDKENGRMRSWE